MAPQFEDKAGTHGFGRAGGGGGRVVVVHGKTLEQSATLPAVYDFGQVPETPCTSIF